jgi:actin-related protein
MVEDDAEIATQILFESFKVPGMFILEKTLAVVWSGYHVRPGN